MPLAWQPLVLRHLVTGRKSLYISAIRNDGVEGLDETAGLGLIEALTEFATQSRFMYKHRREPHDVLISDNRCAIHAATPHDPAERRTMHRATIPGDQPVLAA